jgi:hypothetical protein
MFLAAYGWSLDDSRNLDRDRVLAGQGRRAEGPQLHRLLDLQSDFLSGGSDRRLRGLRLAVPVAASIQIVLGEVTKTYREEVARGEAGAGAVPVGDETTA